MAGRILVLDDEENYAAMLHDLLRESRYQVDMATRPERAIAQLEEIPYDLIISDYKMPVMDGADFLKKARELYPNMPFILVSGLMNTPELVKVANMGVTLVMEKPLNTTAFLEQVARFSTPMSEEEQARDSSDSADGAEPDAVSAFNLPEEPRFFSAGCVISRRFMHRAWHICKDGSYLFMLEPSGGDGELATKDLSICRGHHDRPLTRLSFAEFADNAAEELDEVLADSERSQTVLIRLDALEQMERVKDLLNAHAARLGPEKLLLVFILQADVSESDFLEHAGGHGIMVPPLALRPPDVGQYARRFARMAADRLGKVRCSGFSAEAAFAILRYDWPGNYRQVQEVISRAVVESEDAVLGLPLFAAELEMSSQSVPPPRERLSALLQVAQGNYLRKALLESGLSLPELAAKFDLQPAPESREDLDRLPLKKPQLGFV